MAPHTCHFCDNLIIRPIQNTQTGTLAQFLFNCTFQTLQSSPASNCAFAKFGLDAIDQESGRQSWADSKQITERLLFIKFSRASRSDEFEKVYFVGFLDGTGKEYQEALSGREWPSNSNIDCLVVYTTEGEPHIRLDPITLQAYNF